MQNFSPQFDRKYENLLCPAWLKKKHQNQTKWIIWNRDGKQHAVVLLGGLCPAHKMFAGRVVVCSCRALELHWCCWRGSARLPVLHGWGSSAPGLHSASSCWVMHPSSWAKLLLMSVLLIYHHHKMNFRHMLDFLLKKKIIPVLFLNE